MNLGDVRLVATTKDQSLGFIYGLPLMLFGKMHSMIGWVVIISERSCDPPHEFIIFIAKALNLRICETSLRSYTHCENIHV